MKHLYILYISHVITNKGPLYPSASREVEKTPPRSKAYTRRPPAKSKDAAALAEQRQEMMKTMSRMV